MEFLSLGRLCGSQKLLVGQPSLRGRPVMKLSLLVITCGFVGFYILIGATCAKVVVRVLIIYSFIVLWWQLYGIGYSECSTSRGLCREQLNLFLGWALYKRRGETLFWEVAPSGICWIVWKERNRRAFDSTEGPWTSSRAACFELFILGTMGLWKLRVLPIVLLLILLIALTFVSQLFVYF